MENNGIISELERKLHDGIVEFTYMNKSGEREHTVRGTSTPLHRMFRPGKYEGSATVTFYDMDAEKWRSCLKEHVTEIHSFWPWESDMRVELDPIWVSVTKHGQAAETVVKENRLVKFLETIWSKLRDIVRRPEPKPEYKLYLTGEPIPYNEEEIEDIECEIL